VPPTRRSGATARTYHKPRIKPEHSPRRISGGRIRIGGTVFGIGAEIADPSGFVATMLTLLDGHHTPDEVVARMIAAHPDLTRADAASMLDQLVAAGFVEDADAPENTLTTRERTRYDRGRRFYRWVDRTPRADSWEPQLALRAAAVAVVGVGGAGGQAALELAASGVGHLHVVDRDAVELSNLNRQILYTEADIGRPKVDAAGERLRALNSDIEVTTRRTEISGIADLAGIVAEFDVLLLCADRPGDIRVWANRACLAAGKPWVNSGYHGPRAAVATYVPGTGACYECSWLAEHDREVALGSETPYRTARTSSDAVCAPSAAACGSLAAYAVIGLVTGITEVRPGRIHGVNLVAPEVPYLVDDPRRADCPACGTTGT
jgi:molybdopterin/thiamine biosynthesis adenylyltransferase